MLDGEESWELPKVTADHEVKQDGTSEIIKGLKDPAHQIPTGSFFKGTLHVRQDGAKK